MGKINCYPGFLGLEVLVLVFLFVLRGFFYKEKREKKNREYLARWLTDDSQPYLYIKQSTRCIAPRTCTSEARLSYDVLYVRDRFLCSSPEPWRRIQGFG